MGANPIDAARNNKQKRKRKDRYTSIADHVALELNSPATEDTEENAARDKEHRRATIQPTDGLLHLRLKIDSFLRI